MAKVIQLDTGEVRMTRDTYRPLWGDDGKPHAYVGEVRYPVVFDESLDQGVIELRDIFPEKPRHLLRPLPPTPTFKVDFT